VSRQKIHKKVDKIMAVVKRNLVRIVLISSAPLLLCGCGTEEQLSEQVSLSRESAYRQWQNRKQHEEQAQPRISGRLSVEDCLKLVLVNNKMLQRVLQEREIAGGEKLKSYSAILPKVGLSGEYRKLDKVTSFEIDTGTDKKTIRFGDVDNYSAVLTVAQPIYAGGAITAKLRAAKLFGLLTDQTVRGAVQDVIYAAQHAYYDVVLSHHLVEISTDAVRSSKAHLDSVKQRRQGGVASDFDVLRAEVELSNFQAQLIQNRNSINLAKANLIKVMGVSQDSDFALSDQLVYVPYETTMEQAVETAFRNRPDLFSREYDIKYQQELLKTIRSRYYPTVGAYFDNTWSKPDPHNSMDIDWGHAWQAGLRASLPVFDGLAREGDIVQQKARVRQAQVNLVDTEETALFELTEAILSIRDAKEFVESQKLNLTRAEEGLRLAEVGYKQGTNTQVEMIDAQAALTTAKVNYYQAIYSHVVAKLALQKATGTLADTHTESQSETKTASGSTQDEKG
jgi:outer membrane protein TolC